MQNYLRLAEFLESTQSYAEDFAKIIIRETTKINRYCVWCEGKSKEKRRLLINPPLACSRLAVRWDREIAAGARKSGVEHRLR